MVDAFLAWSDPSLPPYRFPYRFPYCSLNPRRFPGLVGPLPTRPPTGSPTVASIPFRPPGAEHAAAEARRRLLLHRLQFRIKHAACIVALHCWSDQLHIEAAARRAEAVAACRAALAGGDLLALHRTLEAHLARRHVRARYSKADMRDIVDEVGPLPTRPPLPGSPTVASIPFRPPKPWIPLQARGPRRVVSN